MKQINDRFNFDKLFRELMFKGYSHEEAKDFMIHNYSLGILVFQERIENESYRKISANEEMNDLIELKTRIYNRHFLNKKQPFQLRSQPNLKRNVGTTSESIRKSELKTTEEECIGYAYNLVLNRTYEGYVTEIETIYGQLEGALGITIEPAPDDWDRTYSVDFSIKIGDSYIGLQIKPIASGQALNQYQWIEMHANNHERFERDFGGKVFFVYSIKSSGKKKRIYNVEVIEQIKAEIQRLSN